MYIIDFIVVVTSIVTVATITTTNAKSKNADSTVNEYLRRYGFLNNVENNTQISVNEQDEEVKQAISLFQEFYEIPGDGTLNNRTLRQMSKPRCGLPDISHHEQNKGTTKWNKNHLTWNFHLADANTLKTVSYAFSLWAANTSLTFERDVLNPDILISYRDGTHTYANRKEHGIICSASLDGPGGVLAHAFYPSSIPNYTAEIHVDNAERWHIYLDKNPPDKMYLLQTLTHEIGHSLGLPHSSHKNSIMYAYATENDVKLSIEDILIVQRMYGEKERSITTTSVKPPTEVTPKYVDLCDLKHVDTVLILNHRIFITHERYVWSMSIDSKKYDGPTTLNSYMEFLPDNVSLTAAYQRPSGEIVLFANNRMIYMVEYPSFNLKEGWPKPFSSMRFPANVNINSAINTNKGRTYVIFNSNNVAKVDECSMSIVEYQPLQSVFPGIPPTPTLAFRYIDGTLYFANKRQFYKLNEFTGTVTQAGEFDIKILGVVCPRDGLLRQLQDLLQRLIQSSNILLRRGDDDDDDEEEE